MNKIALITGITGQDGSYLAEFLLKKKYIVHGIKRKSSSFNTQRVDHIYIDPHFKTNFFLHYGDLTDSLNVFNHIKEIRPDEIYNLGAMSHVRISFDMPAFTIKTNSLGVLNMLESYRQFCPKAKFYQASSSEMFGNSIDTDGVQRLTTPMTPVGPYGCSKVMGFNLTRHYRDAYKLHACNGILFNHESPRRGTNFVTNKVVKTAVEIKKGLADRLELGNLDSSRDWGHSYDYVRAMHLILNHDVARDWVVATGESHTVRDLCRYVFESLDLNYENYVIQNPKFLRPEELKYLKGDSSKIRKELGWKPEYSFEMLLDEMIDYWLQEI